MSGWSSEGTRVVLGINESEEFRDFLIYTVNDEGQSEVSSVTPRVRTVTVTRAEWRGMTKAGAESKTATENWKITARERIDESGQWRVSEELKVYGEWANVEPEE